jgi:hypothetical protein
MAAHPASETEVVRRAAASPLSCWRRPTTSTEAPVRRAVEVTFEMQNGGQQTLADWMWQQHSRGKSLRTIADELTVKVGVPVSHETVRRWMA